jgi:hypothetical protein
MEKGRSKMEEVRWKMEKGRSKMEDGKGSKMYCLFKISLIWA